eukprot:1834429-Prorocentrum_lima.AAC.1
MLQRRKKRQVKEQKAQDARKKAAMHQLALKHQRHAAAGMRAIQPRLGDESDSDQEAFVSN